MLVKNMANYMLNRKKIKVAYLLGSLNRGGAETLILDVFKNADKADYEMIGIHRKDGPYKNELYATDPQWFCLAPRFAGDLSYFFKLRKLLQKEKVDIVHAQQSIDVIYAKIACLGTGIKIIQTFHGYDSDGGKGTKAIMQKSAKLTDANIYVSETQKKYYLNLYQLQDDGTQFVVYNGINFIKLDKANDSLETELPRHNLNSIKLAMVGNFVAVRDHHTVCRFLKLLKEKAILFDFYFVGRRDNEQAELYDNCVKYCTENGLSDCVHFLGSRKDVPQILQQLDAFIYSTDHDTFGIAIVEAIATGVPTFVNDWEVMKEITNNGEWSTIYRTKDENDLMNKFMLFLQNESIQKQRVSEYSKLIRQHFSIEKHIQTLSQKYQFIHNL